MKRILGLTVLTGLLVFVGIAAGYGISPYRLNAYIDFPFHVGSDLLPAGEYWIEMSTHSSAATGSVVLLRSADGKVSQYLPISTLNADQRQYSAHLCFAKVMGRYFLSEIQQGVVMVTLPKSKLEKELRIASTEAQQTPSLARVKASTKR
jgi:hypothetical protein